jgi:hypothetical protein
MLCNKSLQAEDCLHASEKYQLPDTRAPSLPRCRRVKKA